MKCRLPTLFILFFFIFASSTRLRGISELKSVFTRHQLSLTANSRWHPRESQRESRMKMRHAGSIFFFSLYENTKAQSVRKWGGKKSVFPSGFSFKIQAAFPSQLPLFPALAPWQVLNTHSRARVGGDKETESVCLCARRLWQLPLPSPRPTRERSATLIWRSTPSARRQERERRKQSSLRGGF